jgi:hypothetical protein
MDILSEMNRLIPSNLMEMLIQFGIAIAILVIGWFVAKIVSSLIGKIVWKLSFVETSLAHAGVELSMKALASGVKTLSFIVMMLYVLVAFFQRLNLGAFAAPVENIVASLPQYFGVAVLAAFAWIVANIARHFSSNFLGWTELDAKAWKGTSASIGNALYGFIILFFLPSILGGLGLEEIVAPIQGMLDQMIGYVPNIIGAGIILAVGVFVARLVKQILSSILAASKIDEAVKKVGFWDLSLSNIIGTIAYVFIMIPLAISALDRLQIEAISAPATQMLGKIMNMLPNIIGAIALLTLTYVVANFAAKLVGDLLKNMGFDSILEKAGLKLKTEAPLSAIASKLITVLFMLFAAVEAGNMLGFSIVSDMVSQFIEFGSSILWGLITIVIGLFVANLASEAIKTTSKSTPMANIVKIVVVILSAAIGLGQMGIAEDIINMAFGLGLGAVAVAFALSVGLGSKDVMAKEVEGWLKGMKK